MLVYRGLMFIGRMLDILQCAVSKPLLSMLVEDVAVFCICATFEPPVNSELCKCIQSTSYIPSILPPSSLH